MDHLSHYMINGAPGSIFGLKDGGRMLHGVIPVVADNFPVISGLRRNKIYDLRNVNVIEF